MSRSSFRDLPIYFRTLEKSQDKEKVIYQSEHEQDVVNEGIYVIALQ